MGSPDGADRRWAEDAASSDSTPSGFRPPTRWLLLGVILLAAAAGGLLLFAWGPRADRPRDRGTKEEAESQESAAAAASRSGAAPPPSANDLIAEAHMLASQLVETFPNSPAAHLLMGRVNRGFGNSAKGVECWEKAIAVDPGCGEAYYLIGKVAAERGDHAKAVACFRQAVAREPRVTMIQLDLGESLMQWGKTREAVEVLEQAARSDPRSPLGLFLLGEGYLQLDEFDKARTAFEAAVARAPQEADAASDRTLVRSYYGLARAYTALGQSDKASQWMAKFSALKAQRRLRPGSQPRTDEGLVRRVVARYHVGAGMICAAHERARLAETHWLRAAELDPRDAASLDLLERLYRKQNRTEDAIRISRQRRQIDKARGGGAVEELTVGRDDPR